MSIRRHRLIGLVITFIGAVWLSGPTATHAGGGVLPGESVLSPRQQALALSLVSGSARRALQARFADPALVPVAFVQQVFVSGDEQPGIPPVPQPLISEGSGFAYSEPTSAGSYQSRSVTITVSAFRNTAATSVYEWEVDASVKVSSGDQLHCCNQTEDRLGIAWGNALAFDRDYWGGSYTHGCPRSSWSKTVEIFRRDLTPNAGVGYGWREWGPCANSAHFLGYARHVAVAAFVQRTTYTNTLTNVVVRYFHTFPVLRTSYSLSFSGGSIGISPTSDQWSIATAVAIRT